MLVTQWKGGVKDRGTPPARVWATVSPETQLLVSEGCPPCRHKQVSSLWLCREEQLVWSRPQREVGHPAILPSLACPSPKGTPPTCRALYLSIKGPRFLLPY